MGTGGGQRPEPGRAHGETKEQGRRKQRDGGLCWRLVRLNLCPFIISTPNISPAQQHQGPVRPPNSPGG